MNAGSMVRRSLAAAVGAVLVTALGLVAYQTPALASDSCNFGGRACFYKHSGYPVGSQRRIVQIGQDFNNYHDWNWDGTSEEMNDKLSSLQGHTQGVITLYEHRNTGGDLLFLFAGDWPHHLSSRGFKDVTSSHVWS